MIYYFLCCSEIIYVKHLIKSQVLILFTYINRDIKVIRVLKNNCLDRYYIPSMQYRNQSLIFCNLFFFLQYYNGTYLSSVSLLVYVLTTPLFINNDHTWNMHLFFSLYYDSIVYNNKNISGGEHVPLTSQLQCSVDLIFN